MMTKMCARAFSRLRTGWRCFFDLPDGLQLFCIIFFAAPGWLSADLMGPTIAPGESKTEEKDLMGKEIKKDDADPSSNAAKEGAEGNTSDANKSTDKNGSKDGSDSDLTSNKNNPDHKNTHVPEPKQLQERQKASSEYAKASQGSASPLLASMKNGGSKALAMGSGLASGAAGGMASMAGSLGGLGALSGLGGIAGLAGVGGLGALVGGAALLKLAKGKVSKSICYSACNRVACRSDRVRAMCMTKCAGNPDSIRHCEEQG